MIFNGKTITLSDEDINYIVDNMEIDDKDMGCVKLSQDGIEVTVTAQFEERGYWTTGGEYPGYPPERLWEHIDWHGPSNIKVTANNDYAIVPESYNQLRNWLEYIDVWE